MGVLHGHALQIARCLHGPSSVIWLVLIAVHVVVYLGRALIDSSGDLRPATRSRVPGATWRSYALAATLIFGVVAGAATRSLPTPLDRPATPPRSQPPAANRERANNRGSSDSWRTKSEIRPGDAKLCAEASESDLVWFRNLRTSEHQPNTAKYPGLLAVLRSPRFWLVGRAWRDWRGLAPPSVDSRNRGPRRQPWPPSLRAKCSAQERARVERRPRRLSTRSFIR